MVVVIIIVLFQIKYSLFLVSGHWLAQTSTPHMDKILVWTSYMTYNLTISLFYCIVFTVEPSFKLELTRTSILFNSLDGNLWTLVDTCVSVVCLRVTNFTVLFYCIVQMTTISFLLPSSSFIGWVSSHCGFVFFLQDPIAHCWSEPGHFKQKFCNVCRKRLEDCSAIRCECKYNSVFNSVKTVLLSFAL